MRLRWREPLALGAAVCLSLALAGSAAAAGPRFGLFDLDAGLAKASHNAYGDVRIARSSAALGRAAPGATLVHCSTGCRLGNGWLAFAQPPKLARSDVRGVRVHAGHRGWSIVLTLTARGRLAWARTSRAAGAKAKRTGVPSVYAVVVDGAVVALPFSNDVRAAAGALEVPGFTQSGARKAARLLGF